MTPKTCSACGRPLKTGFMAKGKVVTVPSCKAPLCKKYGKPS